MVYEGVALDDGEHARLASWFHEHECPTWIVDEDKALESAKKMAARLGYCEECEDLAARLLSTSPYIDMSRPDQQVFSDEGMGWKPRPAKIPNHKVPVAINERRRRLMGI